MIIIMEAHEHDWLTQRQHWKLATISRYFLVSLPPTIARVTTRHPIIQDYQSMMRILMTVAAHTIRKLM